MAIIERLRDDCLNNPMKYNIVDLCAGNALTSLIAVHLLPVESATAIDRMERKYLARRFKYIGSDIFQESIYQYINENTIIISVHPCRNLAQRVVEIYNNSKARKLLLMPCCIGKYKLPAHNFLMDKLGAYHAWCYYLAEKCGGNITIDENCISPRNAIITARKKVG